LAGYITMIIISSDHDHDVHDTENFLYRHYDKCKVCLANKSIKIITFSRCRKARTDDQSITRIITIIQCLRDHHEITEPARINANDE